MIFSHPIPVAGLVIRSVDGDVELFNAESGICPGNTGFGNLQVGQGPVSELVLDLKSNLRPANFLVMPALTAETEDGIVFGRHSTHALKMCRG